ncbi:MAG: hypothetical protein IPH06_02505 [Alphaproteobacteria bacterium]|nr:hypothetical protein [Alphaproteobacteria bacterium]QQS56920.1 MAG: hypothetical protein IPN28_11760 [Alphaproteobacteria bacterium]
MSDGDNSNTQSECSSCGFWKCFSKYWREDCLRVIEIVLLALTLLAAVYLGYGQNEISRRQVELENSVSIAVLWENDKIFVENKGQSSVELRKLHFTTFPLSVKNKQFCKNHKLCKTVPILGTSVPLDCACHIQDCRVWEVFEHKQCAFRGTEKHKSLNDCTNKVNQGICHPGNSGFIPKGVRRFIIDFVPSEVIKNSLNPVRTITDGNYPLYFEGEVVRTFDKQVYEFKGFIEFSFVSQKDEKGKEEITALKSFYTSFNEFKEAAPRNWFLRVLDWVLSIFKSSL